MLCCSKQQQDKVLLLKIIFLIKELRMSTNITISTLAKICNYFDISLTDFFIKVDEISTNATPINN
jgi:transcriptional regulator with XRE-family HTH domain